MCPTPAVRPGAVTDSRAGPRQLLTVPHRHRARGSVRPRAAFERDVVGVALPLRRMAKRKTPSVNSISRWVARCRRSRRTGRPGRRAGPFHLEPRWRRLSAALDDEIPSAQQRVGRGARLCEHSGSATAASTTAATPPNATRAIMFPPAVRFCVPGACYDKRLPTLEQSRPSSSRASSRAQATTHDRCATRSHLTHG